MPNTTNLCVLSGTCRLISYSRKRGCAVSPTPMVPIGVAQTRETGLPGRPPGSGGLHNGSTWLKA
jgi:hypothetical protein